jgi:transposase
LVDIFREADTMSTMSDKEPRRTRRSFTDEFKASAIRLVLDEGQSVAAAARDLGLTESSLRNWVEHARADRTKGKTGLTTAEREELARLRKENRVLQEERDILKKVPRSSSRSTVDEIRVHRGGEGLAFDHYPVPVSAGHAKWLLRLASPAGIATHAG